MAFGSLPGASEFVCDVARRPGLFTFVGPYAHVQLAVAHLGLGCIWLFDHHGQPLYRVQSCAGHHATNIAYGGTDRRTLYITESESGSILRAAMPVAGKAMFSHLA